MSAWDWSPYLTGGGTRQDAISGLDARFNAALQRLFATAPENVRNSLRIVSAYRSADVQQRLWDEALAKYGSPEAARRWVAPPGRSRHNHGLAADLSYLDPAAKEWVHANAKNYGLHFPMDWEPWHVELAGSRDVPLPNGVQPSGAAPQPANALAMAPETPQEARPQPLRLSSYQLDPAAFMRPTNQLRGV